MSLPSIFVSIASFRDPECQYTVRDLFRKAAHPERISVGICWQYDPEEDQDCFVVPPPYPAQVRSKRYHIRESRGGCWARSEAMSLLEDEDYALQIDAHMRFVEGWDEIMLDTMARCPTSPAALSTSPPAYHPPDELQNCHDSFAVIRAAMVGGEGDMQPLHLSGCFRTLAQWGGKGPFLTPFFVANFFFAPARMFRDVPLDPHLYFRGQELTYAARLWTHGYDIYQPDELVAYHYWDSKTRASGEEHDYKAANARAQLARQRVWHLLQAEKATDKEALAEIDRYGMGKARPLAAFWEFSGVDLKRRMIGEKAMQGYWSPYRPAMPPTAFAVSPERAEK